MTHSIADQSPVYRPERIDRSGGGAISLGSTESNHQDHHSGPANETEAKTGLIGMSMECDDRFPEMYLG